MNEDKGDKLKPFTFNVVFEPEASQVDSNQKSLIQFIFEILIEYYQADVLEHSGIKRLIDMAIDGFSTTCFCYGQTGSGKTHTLTGPPYLVKNIIACFNKKQI